MAKSAYPLAGDVQTYLEAHGFTLSESLRQLLPGFVEDARYAFERACQRTFLAPAAAAKVFSPPTNREGLLHLGEDLAALTSIVYQPTGSAATTYTLNTDFKLEPDNVTAPAVPYTRVRFSRRWIEPLALVDYKSLTITGQWGYATTIPEGAWTAMLARVAWICAPLLSFGVSGGMTMFQEAGVMEQYAQDPLGTLRKSWGGEDGNGGIFGRAVNTYRRVSL